MARQRNGAIAWMAQNPVAANLLMFGLIGLGLASSCNTKQEVFPTYTPSQVVITYAYPGASPEEVEQGILLAVEEATRGLDGVKRVESSAAKAAVRSTLCSWKTPTSIELSATSKSPSIDYAVYRKMLSGRS